MVLMATCDVHYCFNLVDIGSYSFNNDSGISRIYDSGIFRISTMGKNSFVDEMDLPPPDLIKTVKFK